MNKFEVCEIFWSIQGEGFHSGRAALFIRLPGCNLSCPWCDTDHSSSIEMTAEEIADIALSHNGKVCVITGGEPTISKDLLPIIGLMHELNFFVTIETNGTYAPPKTVDWITVSPKRSAPTPYRICSEALFNASEFKFVVDEDFDFSVLRTYAGLQGKWLYLSPEWSQFKTNSKKIVDYILDHPEWKISPQVHKLIGVQ